MSEEIGSSSSSLSEKQGRQATRTAGSIEAVAFTSYAGPLPHPETLARFEEIFPGAAKRIFDDFEQQSRHRRDSERRIIRAEAFRQIIGSLSAALIGLVGMSGGIWLAHEGRDVTGLTTLIGTLASLVGVYLTQQRRQNQEPSESISRTEEQQR